MLRRLRKSKFKLPRLGLSSSHAPARASASASAIATATASASTTATAAITATTPVDAGPLLHPDNVSVEPGYASIAQFRVLPLAPSQDVIARIVSDPTPKDSPVSLCSGATDYEGSDAKRGSSREPIYAVPIKKNQRIDRKRSIEEASSSVSCENLESTSINEEEHGVCNCNIGVEQDEREKSIGALLTVDGEEEETDSVKHQGPNQKLEHFEEGLKQETEVLRVESQISLDSGFPVQRLESGNQQRQQQQQRSMEKECASRLERSSRLSDLDKDEKEFLRDALHRVTVELGRYQVRFPKFSIDKLQEMLPHDLPVNVTHLSPLLMAYDDLLKEKDDVIAAYEKELSNFEFRTEEIVAENEMLHNSAQRCNRSSPANENMPGWKHLCEHARLVLKENALLVEQQSVARVKAMEMLNSANTVNQQLQAAQNDKKCLQTQLDILRHQHVDVQEQLSRLQVEARDHMIAKTQHQRQLAECKRLIDELRGTCARNVGTARGKVKASRGEQKVLAKRVIDLEAEKMQLTAQVRVLAKAYRSVQRKATSFEQQLHQATQEMAASYKYLLSIQSLVEQIMAERDKCVKLAKNQHGEAMDLMRRVVEGSTTRQKLEETMEHLKSIMVDQLAKASNCRKLEENNIVDQRQEYEREVHHLQLLLKEKQTTVSNLLREKRRMEEDLDHVWRMATDENKEMILSSTAPSSK